MREYEQRFGKTLDEDVKIGFKLPLPPPQVQNHCHLNSHILKSYPQLITMLFDCCRALADTAAGDGVHMDLSMLCKGKKGEFDKKGKSKGKANAKTTRHYAGYCLLCDSWGHAKKNCWCNESAKSEKDTEPLQTPITPAANTTTEPPITGMLLQPDEGEVVPADPARGLYSVTKENPIVQGF